MGSSDPAQASLAEKHPGVRLPHVGRPVLVNVVEEALMRWFEHPEQFAQEQP